MGAIKDKENRRAEERFIPQSTRAASLKRLLGRSHGDELLKKRDRSCRTRDLESKRSGIRLKDQLKPQEATATPLGIDDVCDLAKQSP